MSAHARAGSAFGQTRARRACAELPSSRQGQSEWRRSQTRPGTTHASSVAALVVAPVASLSVPTIVVVAAIAAIAIPVIATVAVAVSVSVCLLLAVVTPAVLSIALPLALVAAAACHVADACAVGRPVGAPRLVAPLVARFVPGGEARSESRGSAAAAAAAAPRVPRVTTAQIRPRRTAALPEVRAKHSRRQPSASPS